MAPPTFARPKVGGGQRLAPPTFGRAKVGGGQRLAFEKARQPQAFEYNGPEVHPAAESEGRAEESRGELGKAAESR